jgi:hypothetical protein
MTKATDNQFASILSEAHAAAAKAQEGMEEGQGLDCGFAWVTISGNEPLARYCRKKEASLDRMTVPYSERGKYGSKASTGWQWWKPGNYPGQSINIHEAGARAFNLVLAKYNIRGTVGSRFD